MHKSKVSCFLKVRGQLHQERSLKLEAFQQVDKLQSQIHSFESALCKSTFPSGAHNTDFCPFLALREHFYSYHLLFSCLRAAELFLKTATFKKRFGR